MVIVMAMEYLTQVISVLITLTQDAIKKEILTTTYSSSSLLLLMGLGTRQDSYGDYRSNVQLLMSRLVITAFEDEPVTLQNLRIYQ